MKREKNKKEKGGSNVTKGGDYNGNAASVGHDLNKSKGTHPSLGSSNIQDDGESRWYDKGNQWDVGAGSKSNKKDNVAGKKK
tara:strand:- start:3231 stop:3476 length:246 start_codon:yes stop_codon:yes gene_type:complete